MKVRLGDYIEQIRGVSYKPSDIEKSLSKNSIVLLRANNIKEDELNFEDVIFVSRKRVSEQQIIRDGDILICASSGSKDLVGKAAQSFNNEEMTFGAFCKVVRSNKIYPKYIGHYFNSPNYRKEISNLSAGANINNIRNEHIDGLKIELPSIEEQKRISEILDKVSNVKILRKNQINKLEILIKSQFIKMFGDPVINPMGWKVEKLKNLSTKIMSGNTPKGGTQVYVENGITFFRSQNVWKNKLELDDIAYIDEETHKKMSISSLKKRDILMTKTGRINTENSSLGRAAMYMGEDDAANINGHVYLVRLKKDIINEFVLFILTTNEYREYIRSVCVGGIDKRQINKEHLEEFPIILPPTAQQKDFVSLLHQVDKQKFELQKSLNELNTLYNALMKKYFS